MAAEEVAAADLVAVAAADMVVAEADLVAVADTAADMVVAEADTAVADTAVAVATAADMAVITVRATAVGILTGACSITAIRGVGGLGIATHTTLTGRRPEFITSAGPIHTATRTLRSVTTPPIGRRSTRAATTSAVDAACSAWPDIFDEQRAARLSLSPTP
jgi:hypothetical protein